MEKILADYFIILFGQFIFQTAAPNKVEYLGQLKIYCHTFYYYRESPHSQWGELRFIHPYS